METPDTWGGVVIQKGSQNLPFPPQTQTSPPPNQSKPAKPHQTQAPPQAQIQFFGPLSQAMVVGQHFTCLLIVV